MDNDKVIAEIREDHDYAENMDQSVIYDQECHDQRGELLRIVDEQRAVIDKVQTIAHECGCNDDDCCCDWCAVEYDLLKATED